jgi:predicted nucleic acid-binding protein
MAGLFLDTSGWIAALLPGQSGHRQALDNYRGAIERRLRLVTTNLVMAATHSLLLRYHGVFHALQFQDYRAPRPAARRNSG